jgi:hypothetical protein
MYVLVMYLFEQKMDWVTFWAAISQTPLVTQMVITCDVAHMQDGVDPGPSFHQGFNFLLNVLNTCGQGI